MKIGEAAAQFLTNERIAVTGVSRNPTKTAANSVYKRFRDRGYQVRAVNPNATEVEGDRCYPDLASIPDGVDGVIIATAPAHAEATVRECIELGIEHVWFHRGPGGGSLDPLSVDLGRANGLQVIDGGCPCMFAQTADLGHRIMRPLLQLTGSVPRTV